MEKYRPNRFSKEEHVEEEIGSYITTPELNVDVETSVQELSKFMTEKNI